MMGKKSALLSYVRNIIAVGLFIIAAGCSNGEQAIDVDMNRRTDLIAPDPGKSLAYAYLPQYSHQISYERHRLLVEYLREATGLSFRQVYPDTFDEHEKMVMRGEIDISFSNPFVYVRLAREGALAFARTIELSGQPDFYSQIIVRADNRAIRTMADCRGKRWIAVDPVSAGGYLFALGHFHDQGLFPEDFAEIAFAPGPGGKQEKVVLSVYAGTYDIGSVRDGTLELMGDRIDLSQIRILAESRHYPGWVYSARSGLDPRVVERVAQAMLALTPDNPAHGKILDTARFKAIVASNDDDFKPIRDLVTKLELD
ncbi:MAG: phosphate/phosphite/phosphonate ABC transporter substrate-binding protein [Pseudomonadota bacterium]